VLYSGDMAKPIKVERNRNVVRLRDRERKSWREIGDIMNLAHSTVWEIYRNEKARSALTFKGQSAVIRVIPR